MKKNQTILFIIIMLNFFVLPEISWSQGQLNLLKRQLKSCNDKDCLQSIQQESESIFNRVGKHFNDDFSGISNQISVNHCHSLVCEIFYHMERLKVYYNFKDVFFMNKLKKLKDNRDRFDSKKLSIEDFERLNQRAEEQYKDDIQSSQHFIDDKVFRLMELCDNLSRNLESIQGSLEMNNRRLNNELTAKILELQNESIWRDFINSSKESKKIEGAIRLASNNAGDKLIPRLKSIFVGFSTSTGNAIFPTALLQRIVKKYPIQ